MADETKPAGQKPAAQQTETKTQPKPAEQPRGGNSGQAEDPTQGLGAAVQAQYDTRTTVPGRPDVDARLDNRQGPFRPPLEEWPAKPQQIDGPDVVHQVEHTRATLGELQDDGVQRKGMFSIGSHGLGRDEELREGRPVQSPDEG
jgi:hypothetical protein